MIISMEPFTEAGSDVRGWKNFTYINKNIFMDLQNGIVFVLPLDRFSLLVELQFKLLI